jgi:hypothetical protein
MHGSIRDRLEDLLGAGQSTGHDDGSNHLSSCLECSTEIQKMRAQSEMLRLLRAPEEVEPAAGFYARVIQRIEERAKESIWAAFIYSRFANRLVYASLAVALVLGSYVIAQESRDGHLGTHGMVAENVPSGAPVFGNQDQQRDAVLENFAAY